MELRGDWSTDMDSVSSRTVFARSQLKLLDERVEPMPSLGWLLRLLESLLTRAVRDDKK